MLDYLQIYPGTKATVQRYKPEDRCLLYEAMMDYAFEGKQPTWPDDDMKWFIWEALKQSVERADAARKRKQEAGRASAEQRRVSQENESQQTSTEINRLQQTSTEPNRGQQSPTQANYEIEIEIEKEKEKEIEKDTENEKSLSATRKARAKEALELFNRFWTAYPRKTAKQNAVKAFGKLKVDESLLKTMLVAIEEQKAGDQWSEPQYIPYPATWLNGHRWEDEVTKGKPKGKSGGVSQTQYTQREYKEEQPGQLPAWLQEEIEQEENEKRKLLSEYGLEDNSENRKRINRVRGELVLV